MQMINMSIHIKLQKCIMSSNYSCKGKKLYCTNKFNDCQNNIRITWLSIDNILKPHSLKKTYPPLCINDKIIYDSSGKAECSNEYFTNMGRELDNNIDVNNIYPRYRTLIISQIYLRTCPLLRMK